MGIVFAILAVVCIIVAAITFVLYGRARMQERELEEKFYLRIHSITLFVLLVIGIVYMFIMVEADV